MVGGAIVALALRYRRPKRIRRCPGWCYRKDSGGRSEFELSDNALTFLFMTSLRDNRRSWRSMASFAMFGEKSNGTLHLRKIVSGACL